MRSQTEIDDQTSRAMDAQAEGSKFPGMSYEDGVQAALDWVTGQTDTEPMEDE